MWERARRVPNVQVPALEAEGASLWASLRLDSESNLDWADLVKPGLTHHFWLTLSYALRKMSRSSHPSLPSPCQNPLSVIRMGDRGQFSWSPRLYGASLPPTAAMGGSRCRSEHTDLLLAQVIPRELGWQWGLLAWESGSPQPGSGPGVSPAVK